MLRFFFGVGLVLCGNASAAGLEPCYGDVDRFCPGIPKNEGDIVRCLYPKEDQLSAACKPAFAARKKEALSGWPCADDAEKFCKDAPKQPGAVGLCLMKNTDKLTPACRDFHKRAAAKLDEVQQQKKEATKQAAKNLNAQPVLPGEYTAPGAPMKPQMPPAIPPRK